jgi:TPR repeat protein
VTEYSLETPEDEDKHSIAVYAKNDLVLSKPGQLLSRLTADVLPWAIRKLMIDDGKAEPSFIRGNKYVEEENFTAALQEFLIAAECGHKKSQYVLATMYLDGRGTPKNLALAYYWFHRAAEQGDPESLNKLGWMCEAGLGVPRNQEKAVNWFRQAAERGHLEAQFNLAAKYDNGEGVLQNDAEAVRWYRLAAEQGLADARFFLAQALEAGQGAPKNIEEALDWYILASEQDHQSAKRRLWALAEASVYLPEDTEEKIFIERLGVEMGSAVAEFKQGYRLLFGDCVVVNTEEAIDLLKQSANKGFLPATAYLSLAFTHGIGVSKDRFMAERWKRRSAQAKMGALEPEWMYRDGLSATVEEVTQFRTNRLLAEAGLAKSISELASDFYFGRGTAVSRRDAVNWASKAAKLGDAYCNYLFGYMLLHGDSVQTDEKLALINLKKAAKLGFVSAGVLAARTILNGSPTASRSKTALQMLVDAAEAGNSEAQFELGYRYTNGLGVSPSQELAVAWYKKAVQHGVAAAEFNLGLKYEYGEAVAKDINEALRLYKSAAQRGLAAACEKLIKIHSGNDSNFHEKNLEESQRWADELTKLRSVKRSESDNNSHISLLTSTSTPRRSRLAEKRQLERRITRALTDD